MDIRQEVRNMPNLYFTWHTSKYTWRLWSTYLPNLVSTHMEVSRSVTVRMWRYIFRISVGLFFPFLGGGRNPWARREEGIIHFHSLDVLYIYIYIYIYAHGSMGYSCKTKQKHKSQGKWYIYFFFKKKNHITRMAGKTIYPILSQPKEISQSPSRYLL